ncbi:hypothetical protein KUW17_14135 [Leisingera aquaemixtae]|uniref:hypothetical protein n=1 Tax=Leisingera aquaemixtae TaxID=1396826 RepID=UPI001C942E69|nr:hypothetical protein [Leisingera aquaemixtae]MBY6067892.1 hypothetical protein [Leisingera aquaemixtae]
MLGALPYRFNIAGSLYQHLQPANGGRRPAREKNTVFPASCKQGLYWRQVKV